MKDLGKRDPGLVRDAVILQSSWMFLNTRVPPFDNLDARRAFSLAIDRPAARGSVGARTRRGRAATSSRRPRRATGPTAPRATCARRAAGATLGHPRRAVTLWSGEPGFTSLNPVIVRALRAIGYRTRVRNLPMHRYFRAVADPENRVQIGPAAWVADYPSDSSFLTAKFSCAALRWIRRGTANSNNSQYCDRRTDALIRRAGEAQTSDPATADALWAQAERRILDAAAAVPLFNPISTDLVSSRVRNDQSSPQWGFLPDQAWVR